MVDVEPAVAEIATTSPGIKACTYDPTDESLTVTFADDLAVGPRGRTRQYIGVPIEWVRGLIEADVGGKMTEFFWRHIDGVYRYVAS